MVYEWYNGFTRVINLFVRVVAKLCTFYSFFFGFGIKRYLKLYVVVIDRDVARFLSKILIHFRIRVAVIWDF